MKVLYSLLALATFALTSCKGELEPQESSVVAETTDASAINPVATTMQPNAVTPSQGATQQTIAQGVNPAHGQPGHRCDVAVGAPLTKTTTSPASSTMTQQVTPQMMTAATPAAQTTVKTAPGMNPPHGQAGHRCDVAVGASLSAAPKPAANANPVTMTPAVVNSNGTITPGSGTTITTTNNNATPAMLKAPSATASGATNPPHGEPGHVCAQ